MSNFLEMTPQRLQKKVENTTGEIAAFYLQLTSTDHKTGLTIPLNCPPTLKNNLVFV